MAQPKLDTLATVLNDLATTLRALGAKREASDKVREMASDVKFWVQAAAQPDASDIDKGFAALAAAMDARDAEEELIRHMPLSALERRQQLQEEERRRRLQEYEEVFGEPTYPRRHPVDEKA